MNDHHIYTQLTGICGRENVMKQEPMANHTLTKIGGKADLFVTPDTYEQAAEIVKLKNRDGIPFMLLGNGSNLIVRDGGLRGIVMHLKKISGLSADGERLTAQGGADIAEASRLAMKNNLTGLEFACGIPGSVGGAMMMNAGAYGGEVKDALGHVKVISQNGELLSVAKEELELGYRTSIIGRKRFIVLEAVFHLSKGNQRVIKETMANLTFQRESKQPLEYPSVGSVFKRPPGYFAGKLIQDSGLQGKGVGGAEVSTKHAGFIVNKADATASDYIATIDMVRAAVKKTFGIDLELEAKIVGEEPDSGVS